jgi:hypothetical protein
MRRFIISTTAGFSVVLLLIGGTGAMEFALASNEKEIIDGQIHSSLSYCFSFNHVFYIPITD